VKKRIKKLITLLLAAAITAAIPLGASAALPVAVRAPEKTDAPESTANSMENALIAAKKIIDIDETIFTDFTYSSTYSNYETMEGLIWMFQWSDRQNEYIHAMVTAEGILIQYQKHSGEDRYFGFADISRNDAIKAAAAFIAKANPKAYTYFKDPKDVTVRINSNQYSLDYRSEVNGVPFESAQISIGVNKFTGEVISYYTASIDPNSFSFEDKTGLISESEAVSAYAAKLGLSLEYLSYFDYENENVKIYPAYIMNSSGNQYISATNGEIIEYVYDRGASDNAKAIGGAPLAEASMDSNAGGSSNGGRASLSPAEITALEKAAGFITGDEALARIIELADIADIDENSFTERNIRLNNYYMFKDKYYYDINLYKVYEMMRGNNDINYLSGRVDAATGRVMSFSYYYFNADSSDKDITDEQAKAAIEAFVKKAAPDEYKKSVLQEQQAPYMTPFGYEPSYYYRYARQENGIPFRGNGISVTLDKATGKVTQYSLDWYDELTFPSVAGVITSEEAMAGYVAQSGSTIIYITTGGGNAALAYSFPYVSGIDPFTGKALAYNGELRADNTITPDYSDVNGHWSEKTVKKLLDNGLYIWSGKFEPDKLMTQQEFLQYLLLLEWYGGVYPVGTELSDYYSRKGINVTVDADKLLTRQEAARIIVEYLGYGKLAVKSGGFVYPFNDTISDQYKGYVAICHMLGIVTGSNGSFNASQNITRAQAAVMLHNMVSVIEG